MPLNTNQGIKNARNLVNDSRVVVIKSQEMYEENFMLCREQREDVKEHRKRLCDMFHTKCETFIQCLTDGHLEQEDVKSMVEDILAIISITPDFKEIRVYEEYLFHQLSEVLPQLRVILTGQIDHVDGNGERQEMKQYSLGALLLSRNCHNEKGECSKRDCKNPINSFDEHEYSCPYHVESLLVHSVMAAIHALMQAHIRRLTKQKKFLAFVTALLHDIGKIVTTRMVDSKNLYISYPGHASRGAMILNIFRNVLRESGMSEHDINVMITVVTYHMCAYRYTRNDIHNALFLTQEQLVLMLILAYGDNLGSFRNSDYLPSYVSITDSIERWYARIVSLQNERTRNPTHTLPADKPILILVAGQSGAGKTTFTQSLMTHLKDAGIPSSSVSRDEAMAALIIGFPIRLKGQAYAALFKVKQLLEQKQRSKTFPDVLHRAVVHLNRLTNCQPIEVSSLLEKFQPGKFVEKLHNWMQLQITELSHSNGIVIIDTVMAGYDAINKVLPPDSDSKAIIIKFHVSYAGTDITSENGMSEDAQMRVTGRNSLLTSSGQFKLSGEGKQEQKGTPQLFFSIYRDSNNNLNGSEYGMSEIIRIYRMNHPPESESESKEMPESKDHSHLTLREFLSMHSEIYNDGHGFLRWLKPYLRREFKIQLTIDDHKYGQFVVFKLQYLQGAKNWKLKWACECRGTWMYYNPDTKEVDYLKSMFPRCPEAPKTLKSRTQDIANGVLSAFPQKIQDAILDMTGDKVSTVGGGTAVGKVDGLLTALSVYFEGTPGYDIALRMLNEESENKQSSDFALNIAYQSFLQSNGRFIIVLSSSGTLVLGDKKTESYMLTAILCGHIGLSRNDLEPYQNKSGVSSHWSQIHMAYRKFVSDLIKLYKINKPFLGECGFLTFVFEAVCASRACCNDVKHPELASHYIVNRFYFLGATREYDGTTKHFPSFVLQEGSFAKPPSWIFPTMSVLKDLRDNFEQMINGAMPAAQFFNLHPSDNKVQEVHQEGFILHLNNGPILKLKPPQYYSAHNMKKSRDDANETKMSEFTCRLFPDLRREGIMTIETFLRMMEEILGIMRTEAMNDVNLFKMRVCGPNPSEVINKLIPCFTERFPDMGKQHRTSDSKSVETATRDCVLVLVKKLLRHLPRENPLSEKSFIRNNHFLPAVDFMRGM
jgi:predicted HD phosphohydrolase